MDIGACRHRNKDGVIEERPEQILMYILHSLTAQPQCGRNIAESAVHQHHIRRVDGNIRSRTDGDAGICPCQSRRIIDSVPDHSDLALLFQSAYYGLLAGRQNARDNLVHTGLPSDRPGGTLVVPRQHDHMDAHISELPDRLRAVLLDGIRHRDHSGEPVVLCEIQTGFSFLCKFLCPVKDRLRHRAFLLYKIKISPGQRPAAPHPMQSVTADGLKSRDIGGYDPLRFRPGQHCPRQRMLTLSFQRRGQGQQFSFCEAFCRNHIRHLRLASGNRSGLIQRDDLRAAGFLQRLRSFKQNPVLRAQAVSDHDCDRCRESQCAGTADYQNSNSAGQRISRILPDEEPDNHRNDCNSDDSGNENSRNLICDLGNRSLCRRSIADHLNNLRQGSILAYAGRFGPDESALIHRRC